MEEPEKMHHPKKKKSKQQIDEERLSELVACVMEALNVESQMESDPFERYALELRLRLHKNVQGSKDHFIEGYKVLLKQLRESS